MERGLNWKTSLTNSAFQPTTCLSICLTAMLIPMFTIGSTNSTRNIIHLVKGKLERWNVDEEGFKFSVRTGGKFFGSSTASPEEKFWPRTGARRRFENPIGHRTRQIFENLDPWWRQMLILAFYASSTSKQTTAWVVGILRKLWSKSLRTLRNLNTRQVRQIIFLQKPNNVKI